MIDAESASLTHREVSRARMLGLWLALFAVAVFPFALCSPVPLGDYTNHLARMHILTHLEDSAFLQQYYAVEWEAIPNLAMDLVVPIPARVIGVERATTLFTMSVLALMASGVVVLHRVLFRHLSYFPFIVFLFLYNRQFLWGFLNYEFGVALSIWCFAGWIYLRNRNPWLRVVLFGALGLVVYISHLYAIGVFGLLVVGYELGRLPRALREEGRRAFGALALAFAPFVMPALLLFRGQKGELAKEMVFVTPFNKIIGALDIFNNYNVPLDVISFGLLGLVLFVGLVTRRIVIQRDMVVPLVLLTVAYLALPHVLFGGVGADRRLVPVLFLVFAASANWQGVAGPAQSSLRPFPGPWPRRLAVAVLVLFVVRMAVISAAWWRADSIYEDVEHAIAQLAEGDRLAIAAVTTKSPWLMIPPVRHIANLAVLRRDAFVNSLFAAPGHQVLRVLYNTDTNFYRMPSHQYTADNLSSDPPVATDNFYEKAPLHRFDYVMVINRRFFVHDPPGFLTPVYEASSPGAEPWEAFDMTLYKVGEPDDPAPSN